MEQWEHMTVQAQLSETSKELYAITAEGKKTLIDHEDASIGRTIRALNELGREGWQLVDTELMTTSFGAALTTFFMKRRLPEKSGGGWATTI
jgi:hypothetical protein